MNLILKTVKPLIFFAVLGIFASVTILVHGQDNSGFISIDCGILNDSSYFDEGTKLKYESDAKYIDTGTSMNISSEHNNSGLIQQFWNVRSFPKGVRNCYTFTPSQATVNATYLIRASFLYGDYDGHNQVPKFDLHLGVNMWDTVSFLDSSTVVTKEIIHVISSKMIHICLVNTGSGTPFISSLELRPLDSSIYKTQIGSLLLYARLNFGYSKNETIRYRDDIFDRIWKPFYLDDTDPLSTSLRITEDNKYDIPFFVIGTAVSPRNADESLNFYRHFSDNTTESYIYMHFAELQLLQNNQSREFNIYMNGKLWFGPFSPEFTSSTTVYNVYPYTNEWLNISLSKTGNSTLPPIINAIEIYTEKELLQPQTNDEDASAMMNIKSFYGLVRNWQGDPCAPKEFFWNGVQCSYSEITTLRVIHLDLSSSGLTGEITSYISNLTLIQYLDLSNNNLTGKVPSFLAQLPFLTVIKLTKNNLTGPLPGKLLENSRKGLLTVSTDDYLNPCFSVPCKENNNSKIVAVVASVGALITALIALTTLWTYKRNRLKKGMRKKLKGRLTDTTNRQFTYSEILTITNDLETVIGKGGFGPVYHGNLEGTEVAVKMLSASSRQGYKEFRAEIEFLTRVHHVNLTTLVGYCDEGDKIGLIYEFMSNGNLKECLSDRHPNFLSWEERLHIALDAATGLEYLHHGCKPPIIHRDVKSDNILLDQKFRAKLADFGLSKDFPVDKTHVSTALAGTFGYLDPEYYISYKLKEKSDIFSFGVVLLEIITGQPVLIRDQENAHIIQRVSFMLKSEEDITNIIDPRLGGDFEMNSLKKVIDIAMACASPTSVLRPSMNCVVMELNHCLALEMARTNGNSVTKIREESQKSRDGHVTEIEVVSMNFSSLPGR